MEPVDPVNILLVDDRPENLTALTSILDQPGYRLVSVTSATDALRWLLRDSFAVVLLDVLMPIMDGIELATLIKSREKSRNLPIIFLTASGSDVERILEAYSLGAVDYLVRPVHPAVVRAKVAVFADLFRKTEEIRRQAALLREHDQKEQLELRGHAQVARARAAEMQRHMTIVAEVSRLLSESLDLGTSLGKVARHLVDTLSPGCVIEILDDDGKPSPAAVAHQDPREEAQIRDRFSRKRSAEEEGTLVTPIEAGGATLGAITLLGSRRSQGWDPEERELVRDIGRRVGLFVQNAGLYEKERRAVSARDELLSLAAHELRTPLTAMMLQIQALARSLRRERGPMFPVDLAMTKIEAAERQLARLTYLIEALLDVSRIAAHKLSLELEKVDLAKVARDVAARFAETAAREGATIEVVASEPVIGLWDPVRVEQIVTNLVANAVKYGPNKPIEIRVRGDCATAELTVRDHGIGIAPEHIGRIFDRFERAVSSTSYGGLGLGLYITKQLVTAHGGTISVESELGQGAELTVRLPRAVASSAELLDDAEQHADLDRLSQHA